MNFNTRILLTKMLTMFLKFIYIALQLIKGAIQTQNNINFNDGKFNDLSRFLTSTMS